MIYAEYKIHRTTYNALNDKTTYHLSVKPWQQYVAKVNIESIGTRLSTYKLKKMLKEVFETSKASIKYNPHL